MSTTQIKIDDTWVDIFWYQQPHQPLHSRGGGGDSPCILVSDSASQSLCTAWIYPSACLAWPGNGCRVDENVWIIYPFSNITYPSRLNEMRPFRGITNLWRDPLDCETCCNVVEEKRAYISALRECHLDDGIMAWWLSNVVRPHLVAFHWLTTNVRPSFISEVAKSTPKSCTLSNATQRFAHLERKGEPKEG